MCSDASAVYEVSECMWSVKCKAGVCDDLILDVMMSESAECSKK